MSFRESRKYRAGSLRGRIAAIADVYGFSPATVWAWREKGILTDRINLLAFSSLTGNKTGPKPRKRKKAKPERKKKK